MDDLIKLVKTYRLTEGLSERLRLADEIFRVTEPQLRLFVYGNVSHQEAEDVLQEVLKAVATSLRTFSGSTTKEFWAWCYRIARNKRNDHFRDSAKDLLQPMSPEELWQLVDASAHTSPISHAEKDDLDYAMKLLTASKPECYDYLWQHYVIGFDYTEIAAEQELTYDAVRMKIGRCLETAQNLVA